MRTISALRLVLQFPKGPLVYVAIMSDIPDPKNPKALLKDQDIVRVLKDGSMELLASHRGNWAKKYKQTVLETYEATESIYDEESNGAITARPFYREDKRLLKGWQFISRAKLEKLLKDLPPSKSMPTVPPKGNKRPDLLIKESL